MAVVVVERRIECASEPSALWRVITDTERLNRAVGLGALQLEPIDEGGAARYLVSTVSGGFPLQYEERPFEWVENERFTVQRVTRKGATRSMENSFAIEATPKHGGTLVTIRISVDPKLGLIAPIVRLQVTRILAKMARYIEAADAALARGELPELEHQSHVDKTALAARARALVDRVTQAQRPAAKHLIELVERGSDADVSRIRPFELAERWQLERRAVLAACLQAVRAGVLELSWDLVCPSCRTASDQAATLGELPEGGHCQLCDISYELDLDRAVEATFRPAKALRAVDGGPYCIGGPARTPHVVAQVIVQDGGKGELRAPAEVGRYRVFVRGGAVAAVEVREGAAQRVELQHSSDGLTPAQVEVAPGGLLCVSHTAGEERHVKLERLDYASRAATAHFVSTLPEFRRQFRSEVLRPGVSLSVSRVALLFTDLTGSTQLYTELGDAGAFDVVQSHFELLASIVEKQRGVVVKTIGDAIMAAFLSEQDAVIAARRMHEAFAEFRGQHARAGAVSLKVGVHAGPCYVVTANGVLDYFGQTVNVAARLQGQARPGELVMTADLANEAQGGGWLGDLDSAEHFEATLKGVSGPVAATRFKVDTAA